MCKERVLLWLLLLGAALPASAVEVAPRISDREIIEALAQLREGQKTLNARIDALDQKIDTEVAGLHQKIDIKTAALDQKIEAQGKALNARMDALEARIDALDQKIDTKTAELSARIQALDQKIDTTAAALNEKIDAQGAMMQARFADLQKSMEQSMGYLWAVMVVMLAGIFGLIGFVVWDRKTALKPLEQRMVRLEQEMHEVHTELQAQHGEEGLLRRIVHALRALAAEDERIARVLRQCSLL